MDTSQGAAAPGEYLVSEYLVVVIADGEEVIRKLNVWRRGLEKKGLTVNLSSCMEGKGIIQRKQ